MDLAARHAAGVEFRDVHFFDHLPPKFVYDINSVASKWSHIKGTFAKVKITTNILSNSPTVRTNMLILTFEPAKEFARFSR